MLATDSGSLKATIERDGQEVDVTFTYTVTAGSPASYHPWHGWSPPEGPECEVYDVHRDDTGAEVEFTEDECNRIEGLVWEHVAEKEKTDDSE